MSGTGLGVKGGDLIWNLGQYDVTNISRISWSKLNLILIKYQQLLHERSCKMLVKIAGVFYETFIGPLAKKKI